MTSHSFLLNATIWPFAAAALLLAACTDSLAPSPPAGMAKLSLAANLAGAPVSAMVVHVAAADLAQPLLFNMQVSEGAASGSFHIPAGSARTITLRAFDVAGVETHRGARVVDVLAGSNPTVSIVLTPLVGEQPIEAVVGSVVVSVAPAAVALAPGQTAVLAATVTDTLGRPVPAHVQWASLRPRVATVDSAGRVTARDTGQASIVGVYGAVGAAAVVTVIAP